MVVHLSTDEELKAGKALRFAMQSLSFAEETILYLSAEGVRVADKSTDGFTIPTKTTNSLDVIREFIAEGGKVIVGADCMKSQGIGAGNLIAGSQQGDPKTTFALLLADNTVVMSW
jgi:predicted peroxiredoxin